MNCVHITGQRDKCHVKCFDAPTVNSDFITTRQDFLCAYSASNIHYIQYISRVFE